MAEREQVQNVLIKKYLYQKAAMNRIPISGTFELTPLCNFNCSMCYIHQTKQEMEQNKRSSMQLQDWLKLAEDMKNKGLLYLLLTGGEPLLWPDFKKLYEALYSMGFLLSVNTNASLIDETWVAFFRKMPPQRINITLYGSSEDTYQLLCGVSNRFAGVVHAIEALKEAGVSLKINCTVTPDNKKDFLSVLSFAKERDIPLESTAYMYPPVRRDKDLTGKNRRLTPSESAMIRLDKAKASLEPERYREFLTSLIQHTADPAGFAEDCGDCEDGSMHCMAGKASCWITWDGYLSLCGMIPDYRIDLCETAFAEGWKRLVQMGEEIRLSGTCEKCPDRGICNPCAAVAYAETGSCDGASRYSCETIRCLRQHAKDQLTSIE